MSTFVRDTIKGTVEVLIAASTISELCEYSESPASIEELDQAMWVPPAVGHQYAIEDVVVGLGESVADPPSAESGQDEGESDEDRRLVPLKRPVTARGLERDDIPQTG